MGKGAKGILLNNAGTGQTRSADVGGRAQDLSGFLTPQLEQRATNPQGYTPQQLAYMNTASQQSLGGGTAATTGAADLTAARTRNAGGFQGAVGTANRNTQKQASQNSLQIQQSQADLQQQEQQQALASLQQLYGVDQQTALGYLNASTSAASGGKSGGGAGTSDAAIGAGGAIAAAAIAA